MPFAIIGAGRSGTSMLAGMLDMCGAYLGEPPDLDRTRQPLYSEYWEDATLIHLVLDLSVHLRAAYGTIASLPVGWQNEPALEPFYERAGAMVRGVYSSHDIYGMKHPKMSLLIPFWKRAIPDLKFVICVRNPAAYASSLDKVIGRARKFAYNGWLYTNMVVLQQTEPSERIICFYEDFFPDYRKGLFPALDFLGMRRPEPGDAADKGISVFFDPTRKHHSATIEELEDDPDASYWVVELYRDLLSADQHASTLRALNQCDKFMPLLNCAIEAEEELAISTNTTKWLERVLSSRTHRLASTICSLLIRLRGPRYPVNGRPRIS